MPTSLAASSSVILRYSLAILLLLASSAHQEEDHARHADHQPPRDGSFVEGEGHVDQARNQPRQQHQTEPSPENRVEHCFSISSPLNLCTVRPMSRGGPDQFFAMVAVLRLAPAGDAQSKELKGQPIRNSLSLGTDCFANNLLSLLILNQSSQFLVVHRSLMVLVIVLVRRVDVPSSFHVQLTQEQHAIGANLPMLDSSELRSYPSPSVGRELPRLVTPRTNGPTATHVVGPLPGLEQQRLTRTEPQGPDVGSLRSANGNLTDSSFGRLVNQPAPKLKEMRILFAKNNIALGMSEGVARASAEGLDDGIVQRARLALAASPFATKPFEQRTGYNVRIHHTNLITLC